MASHAPSRRWLPLGCDPSESEVRHQGWGFNRYHFEADNRRLIIFPHLGVNSQGHQSRQHSNGPRGRYLPEWFWSERPCQAGTQEVDLRRISLLDGTRGHGAEWWLWLQSRYLVTWSHSNRACIRWRTKFWIAGHEGFARYFKFSSANTFQAWGLEYGIQKLCKQLPSEGTREEDEHWSVVQWAQEILWKGKGFKLYQAKPFSRSRASRITLG